MGKGLADQAKKAFGKVRDNAIDLVSDLKEEAGYEDKTKQYINNLNANMDRISEILDNADKTFMNGCRTGNFENAFKGFMKAVKACTMMMKIAVVEVAEELGLNDFLRKKGIVEKSPINIMKEFERQLDDLQPSLKEAAQKAAKDIKKFAKDTAKEVKHELKR